MEHALRDPNGLLMAGGALAPARLLAAYRRGIFPWYSAGEPVLWWSPDPRCVLWPHKLKVARSLRKSMR
ncbi:MAG: leucyl/phenylalanyl-tRNA--protein transferase, partial [Pseudomonas stutzeri]|nr:leucyl/phenylalanyl-tRNA--protein transferase [Stutzerimonas stutzeri]NIN29905.1 leucyl/phenylalanyl-tRNA--protein transferase [Hydrogenophaga sp.]NIN54380.1 leucyl/phenylalanyl-tRNA--protein transferase [Hydrogenophaga sp.]NIN81830.1 leucyl/phenylalanyl-tRNA--protein transferase [Stutzerimonas stutzeri]NIP02754.1 leucyl/phenylalanyl-tRNA--protein transferase [Stutzerimonas stutzeri]